MKDFPSKKPDIAHIVSVHMGLGHLRAAYPLRNFSREGIIIWGSGKFAGPGEKKYWRAVRKIYYFLSRSGSYPVIGRLSLKTILAIQNIPSFYPRKDRRRSTSAVKFLKLLIEKAGLCRTLSGHLSSENLPVIHTFYATAIAQEMLLRRENKQRNIYLLICDADINRVWVPEKPQESRIKYLVPCTRVKSRLLSYGVKEEQIFMTGFPLPVENIGTETGLEVLRLDLKARLKRLDPKGKFFAYHRHSVSHLLGKNNPNETVDDRLTVMFAIGGAGAQVNLVDKIIIGLQDFIRSGRIRLVLSCGVKRQVLEKVLKFINTRGLLNQIGRNIELVFHDEVFNYFEQFNCWLRQTDVLWTKPSELSFYCALGLPVLMSEPIGPQEEYNKRWLTEIHAGLEPPGLPEYCGEWLMDLRDNGRLAEAAWDGFLKARKLGYYKIKRLIETGEYNEDISPLNQ